MDWRLGPYDPILGATERRYRLSETDAGLIEYVLVTAQTADATTSIRSEPIQVALPGDHPGEAADDQWAPIVDETHEEVVTPAAMTPTVLAAPGSYTTEEVGGEAVNFDKNLRVVSSTAPGTIALTGLVGSEIRGKVAGARVTLTNSPLSVTTNADADGAFAFVHMPAGVYDLIVSARGHGIYKQLGERFSANETYQINVYLEAEPRTTQSGGRG